MVERVKKQKDEFIGFRNVSVWSPLKPIIANEFPDKIIPPELEPHLIEWATLKTKIKTGEIKREEVRPLEIRFSEGHDELFNNSLFIVAIRKITNSIAG